MAKLGFTIEGDKISGLSTFTVSPEDAERILGYGARKFSTIDPNEIVAKFADLFIGNLLADVKSDEQRIAAASASESVKDLVATPDLKA